MPHIFLIFCLIWIQAAAQVGQPPELHIKTSSGIINGKYNNTAQTVRGFIGVPYAEPPVGRLRWEPPRPKSPPSHPIDAFSFSNPCAQVYTYSNESIWSILPYKIWNAANMSEDCLYMNIWAPSTKHHSKKRKAAVMMFIHGGSYASGSGSVSYYDGTNLVQDDEDIIAVTFNYRLNIFGFPNSPGLDPKKQNLGLLDQRMAIEWVHMNIGNFGGDPNRILLFSQSAGASSADLYSYAYPKDPLVSAFALHSGTAPLLLSPPDHENWNNLSTDLGCDIGKRSHYCMNQIPAMRIVETRAQGNYNFYPVVDELLVFSDYVARCDKGQLARLPTLAGMTERECSALVPLNQVSVNMTEIYEVGRFRYNCPLWESVRIRVRHNVTTWRYLYHGNFSSLSLTTWLGAYHGAEIPMVFRTYNFSSASSTSIEVQASKYIQGAWTSFAKDPLTGLRTYGWPQYRFNEPTLINIAFNNTIPAVLSSAPWDHSCKDVIVQRSEL